MITIAKYGTIMDAQRDADRILKRGIEVEIVESGLGGVIGGGAPSFELQVSPENYPKLEAIQEELQDEIIEENLYSCPVCESKDYEPNEAGGGILSVLFARRNVHSGVKRFRCLDCGVLFKVRVD